MSRFKFNLETKKGLWGYIFVGPFIIGFIIFFLYPFVQSIVFSLNELEITPQGFKLNFVGLKNYDYAFFVHSNFVRVLLNVIFTTLTHVPAIIIFSFLAATLLNQRFRGRTLARIIFFLPVIFTAEVVTQMAGGDFLHRVIQSGGNLGDAAEAGMLSSTAVRSLLMQMKLPEGFVTYIINAVDQIPQIINASAIPILIFLAGLQSIPASLYEAVRIEGATGWESFWKITFPMISPLILTNIIYIIIDSFTSNPIVNMIESMVYSAGYGVSAAMSWIYFIVIAFILIISYRIISRNVFYYE